jgi:hypothetical protein
VHINIHKAHSVFWEMGTFLISPGAKEGCQGSVTISLLLAAAGYARFAAGEREDSSLDPAANLPLAQLLSQLGDHGARGQRKHQPGESAEDHADPHERADGPCGARWPRLPNQHAEDQRDDSVKHQPD